MLLTFYAKTPKRPFLMQFIGVPEGPRAPGPGPFDSLDCSERVPGGTMPLRGASSSRITPLRGMVPPGTRSEQSKESNGPGPGALGPSGTPINCIKNGRFGVFA
uniref:Uncharacterized protein n=1 Tax=Glossina pallidipes TaxID=7398 RepID=A0A1B0AJT7_GLOPL